jgi:hypothetical protein
MWLCLFVCVCVCGCYPFLHIPKEKRHISQRFLWIRIRIFTLKRIRIKIFTSMQISSYPAPVLRIRIQFFTLMGIRIRIQLLSAMRIRIHISGSFHIRIYITSCMYPLRPYTAAKICFLYLIQRICKNNLGGRGWHHYLFTL